jgi:hypothetical protein
MAAAQKPEVVAQWVEAASNQHTGVQWAADLDNQNWQHELCELQEMWLCRAEAYERMHDEASKDKAAACRKIGNAFSRSVVKTPAGYARVFSGMFSGQRGTTRDNTEKHEIDRLCSLDELAALGHNVAHWGVSESGDDEWLKTATWLEGVRYVQVLRMMGVRMNARKQLAGAKHSTYLQRAISGEAAPKQPIAGILSTLCTGNWYAPVGTWFNQALASTCANWLEASARGLARTVAARMCAMTLDQVMRVRQTKEQLDWRQYVLSDSAGSVLFAGCRGAGIHELPDVKDGSKMYPSFYAPGVSDYLRTDEARWILRSCGKEFLRKQFKEGTAIDALGSLVKTAQRDRVAADVAVKYAKGRTEIDIPPGLDELSPAPNLSETASMLQAISANGPVVTIDDNLAAMGLGKRETVLLGGYEELLRTAPPAKLSRVRPTGELCENQRSSSIDANIMANLVRTPYELKQLGLMRSKRRRIRVVAAEHGMGVSALCRRMTQRYAARFDRAAAELLGNEAYARNASDYVSQENRTRHAADALAARLASGHRPDLRVLFCHEHPFVIADALKRYGIESDVLWYTDDRVDQARRLASRNLAPGLLRHMYSHWRNLFKLRGFADEIQGPERIMQVCKHDKLIAA